MKDVFEVAQLSAEKRATFYQVKSNSRTEGRQIDFAFLSPLLQAQLKANSALAYRYRDEFGMEQGVPHNMEAKLRLPSDHYPVVFEIENIQLR